LFISKPKLAVLITLIATTAVVLTAVAALWVTINYSLSDQRTLIQVLTTDIVGPDGAIVRVPYGQQVDSCRSMDSQIFVSLLENRSMRINQQPAERTRLDNVLGDIFSGPRCKVLYLDPHPNVNWGDVVYVIDVGKGVDVSSLLITESVRRELGYAPR
jgi:biopolymer transport protein ExbD